MNCLVRRNIDRPAFTLLETMVSVAVLALILIAVFSLLSMTSVSYRQTTAKLDSFDAGRAAFDALARGVRQATLQSYVGYDDPLAPSDYQLKSDLHFVCGPSRELGLADLGAADSHAIFFQAPLGAADDPNLASANVLLNAAGYFIALGNDPLRPAVLEDRVGNRPRFRLFQFQSPREQMKVYDHTIQLQEGVPVSDETYTQFDWFQPDARAGRQAHVLAENVVALAILPVADGGNSPRYLWNSRDKSPSHAHNRLPHSLKVAMAVIDEADAERLGAAAAELPDGLFSNPEEFDADLDRLEDHFLAQAPPVNVRIFRTEIPLHHGDTSL